MPLDKKSGLKEDSKNGENHTFDFMKKPKVPTWTIENLLNK